MMDKFMTVFLLIACSHLVIANKRPIHSVLAPAETIYNYETVSPIIIYQSIETTDGNPDDLWIKLDVPNEKFELHLTINKNLISPKYTETVFKTRLKNCFYHGAVVGFANWTVAMSTCTGLRGTFGDHDDFDTLYHIEPLERISDKVEQAHIVFSSLELSVENRNRTCGCTDSHRDVLQHMYNITEPLDRVRRQSVTWIVEWFVINDRRQFIAQGRNLRWTEQRSIEIANVVDMLFAKIGIRVTLVGVETWSRRDQLSFSLNPSTLLLRFIEHLRLRNEKFDSAMLITGSDLDGQTLGIATLGTMCRGRSAAGVTQDTGSSVAFVGAIAAHELGHIFNMEHDDGRGCTCTGTNNRCIMRAFASSPPPVEWSSCSIRDLNNGLARGLGRCLQSERSLTGLDETECGDGIREGNEACDCGTPALCDDPCCNPHTCQLINGAVCSSREPCCSECQFEPSGMMCRSANNECDIPEYCNGTTGECPSNRYRQNGAECASGQAYCSNGLCQDLNATCNASFVPKDGIVSTVGPQECFNFNTAGTQFGNCGHNYNTFLACATADVRCGQLQCRDSGDFRLSAGTDITVISQSITHRGQKLVQCRSFTTQPGADIRPGLVPEGAKCGFNRFCRNQKCVRRQFITCPSVNSQECSGNGVCNDLDRCSCYSGFTGDTCNSRLTRGRGSHHKEQSQLK